MAELQKSFKASSPLSIVSHLLHLVLLFWLSITARSSMAATEIPVGVILDLSSKLGITVYNSLEFAVQNYYSDNKQTATVIRLIVRNVSDNNFALAAHEAHDLMNKRNVCAILGPQNPEQARYIVKLADGDFNQKPVIWFPITGPSLSTPPSPSSIYTGQGLNCFQFQAIAATISSLGWQSVVPIYEETEYGSHLVPCLTNVLKDMGIKMANVTAINSSLTEPDINQTLDNLISMRTHVFLVHMSIDLGTRFILAAENKTMMGEGYAWILTQELSSLTNPQVRLTRELYKGNVKTEDFYDFVPLKRYMQGALVVRPMDNNKTNWRRAMEKNFFHVYERSSRGGLTIYGWWAYHTIEALAKALEKLGSESCYNNGKKLGEAIKATSFSGDSGVKFNLSLGQLDQYEFEVYNVISDGERIIGSWSPQTGLVKDYSKVSGDGVDVASGGREYKLKDPMWPGYTLDKPPKLKIGVPETKSYPEFVGVYNSTNKLWVDGLSFNVFLKALDVLPFPLNNYEFVPLPNQSRSSNTSYDDMLCNQMKVEELDAIIGDMTIVESRTECVDFTLPYLDSSVVMVVRVKEGSTSGILFKPFEGLLWLTLGVIFVAATVIIIVLEKYKTKTNNETTNIDRFLINPFLVYKLDVMETFASGAAGWMVILTSFLFVLVVQVYTANLTSILTQGREKEPTFKNETELIKKNLPVGYRNGSWVEGFLVHQLRFNPEKIKPLSSREEFNESLSIGSEHGGVDAIIDETPYLTLFLSKYKSRFMMVGPMYKSGGFAFAFPKNSSLASHFSKAILNVTRDADSYRVLRSRSSLPTSVEDLEFEDKKDVESSKLEIEIFGGLWPVLLSVVALFLCLSIPSVIIRLRNWWPEKKPSSKN